MPRRRRVTKGRIGGLLLDREHDDEMDLQIGPGRDPSAAELERLRGLWFEHRDELTTAGSAGSRPWGFYVFELGLVGFPDFTVVDSRGFVVPGIDGEERWLRKHGHLTVFEERELRRERLARSAS
jgi:hypothetical protein